MSLRSILLVSLLCFVAGKAFAQRSEADSLESLVKSVPSDTNKVWLLNRLVDALREKDNNKALTFAEQASELAELLTYKKGLSHALENQGWILYRKGDYSKSLEISTRALKVSEEIADRYSVARCLINIAAIYYEQKQYQAAIDNFRKAYRVAVVTGDSLIKARCFNNIGYTFLGLNELDSALHYTKQALVLSETAQNPYMVAFARRTLGDIYLLENNTDEALSNFNSCLDLSVKHNNTFLKASVLHRLGKTYNTLGKYDKALSYLSENIKIGNEFGFKDELERAYKMASEIYYNKKDLDKAYQYQSAYINLHDSLYNQRSSEQIALMQIQFDTEIKEAQIELLTKEAALKVQEINSQKVWIYFYVGCLSLLVILAFVLFYNNRLNSKAKMILQEKNKEIEIQTHQLRNLNSTKDKLFSIISHDLRSPVASLRALMDLVGSDGLTQDEFVELTKALKRNLDSVYGDLDNLLLWAQTQLKGLQISPEEIDLQKLASEKIDLFNEIAGKKKITVVNGIRPGACVFADRNHLSLVFRNLIANAIKFNHPGGRIEIESREHPDYYEIAISDSGVGMSQDDVAKLFNAETHFTRPGTSKEKGVGIGLLLTKEFVEANHGSIWVNSVIGKGTTFTFTLKAAKLTVYA